LSDTGNLRDEMTREDEREEKEKEKEEEEEGRRLRI
jgi:hypothetical protein